MVPASTFSTGLWILLSGCLLVVSSPGSGVARGASSSKVERPNFLLIMADDLGYECLGSYGGTSYETPALDALAASGVRFTNGFSTPKCSPTRVTLLTGRYTFRTTNKWGYIPPDEVTIGHVLQGAGYKTALAGKWQLGLLKEDPLRVSRAGFGENCCWAWHEGPRYWKPMMYQNGKVRTGVEGRYGPDVFCDFLIEFIRGNKTRPFFAYYPMALTHWPKPDEPKGPNGRYETFREMVAEMDKRVGRLVAELDRLQLRRNTLILFTGDNGTPRNVTSKIGGKTLRGGKGQLTDLGTRVPLIASWPGTLPAGKVRDDLIDFTDFFPTLAELAGAPLPQNVPIDGRSFAALLPGEGRGPRDWVYTEFEGKCWIRDRRWKLYGKGRLFDMQEDPEESNALPPEGLAADARNARQRLQRALGELKN